MSRAYGWRASCPAGGVTAVGVGSGAWFASVVLADWVIWGGWVYSSEGFAPSLTGIEYWRVLFQFWGFRSISDFFLPKSVYPVVAILSGDAWRNILSTANDIDEPRLRLARLLPRRRRDRRGRWLWRLVRPKFRG